MTNIKYSKSKQTTEWKRKKKPKNMLINIKRINSLSVLLIGYLKLFQKQKVMKHEPKSL